PVSAEDLMGYLADRVAKWWLPDEVVFTDELPHTPTGKVLKTRLRELYVDHVLASVRESA
ncbi:MAG: long-chain fatty acid--CoA ligase, partial [Alphaproteobacteria bacterium]|nr:long-chain fatty acid--CoA ligase [Alphaproteobacteria bacterium]